jgi:curved DNA-binding protein CbpA
MKNYYYILGVKESSSLAEIKSAYRKLSIKFHPDKNPGDKFFEERFKDIQEGYETLSDVHKRKIYDEQFQEFANENQTEFDEKSKGKSSGDEYGLEQIRTAKKSKRKNDIEESQFFYNIIQGTLMTLFCLCSLYAIYDIVISPLIKRFVS